jgi:hypothetical protein
MIIDIMQKPASHCWVGARSTPVCCTTCGGHCQAVLLQPLYMACA